MHGFCVDYNTFDISNSVDIDQQLLEENNGK